ncbi:MAG: two-component regulator propeller domain-containing protein [Pyrinomonadaceae bacterium]
MRAIASRTEPFFLRHRFARRTLLLLLLLLMPTAALAEQLPVKTYTIADGLARDTIKRIVQDPQGFLWFCTTEGLSRFDGYKFTNYRTDQGLPHFIVNDLLRTRGGFYLIATGGGVSLFNPVVASSQVGEASTSSPQADRSRFVVYRLGESEKTQYVNVLLEDRTGAVWGGTRGGLYRLTQRDGQWVSEVVDVGLPTASRDDNIVFALLEDRAGTLWIGAGSGLYRRFTDGRVERYTTGQGLPANRILTLFEDRAGKLWAGTSQGLCRIVDEPRANERVAARLYTTAEGLAHNEVVTILEAAGGGLWIGTNGGLSELGFPADAQEGKILHSYTAANGLSDNLMTALAEDRDGNLWVGTESGGAMKIARHGFINYKESDGLGGVDINSIFVSQAGELCVTSGKLFVHQFDGNRFKRIGPNFPAGVKEFSDGWYQTIFQDHAGEWWVPTGEGLYRFARTEGLEQLAHARPAAVYKMSDGLAGDGIFRLFEDSRGDIWVSTFSHVPGQSGLTRWERSSEKFHRYGDAEGVGQSVPTAFAEDAAGNVWVGFYRGGLARYRDGRFTHFKTTDGVPGGLIRALYVDHAGRLWVGTGQTNQSGLCRLDDVSAERPRFTLYTTAQGLGSNDIHCVTEDRWGRIYIGTGQGVDRLDPETGSVRRYTAADGLGNNTINVALRDPQGTLWFGTYRGLSRLVPVPDPPRAPPPVMINGLRIAGITYGVSELGQAAVNGLELGASQNQIEIDFLGIDFTPSEVLRYQYKLEGGGGDWSAPTDQRSVNYANLSPGTYRFLVRAVNASNIYSQMPAAVDFRILPPVYRRWWFLTLCAALVALTVFSIERYRAARMRELNAALSESKQLTESLSEQRTELHQVNRTLELQYTITSILAEARSLREAAAPILRAICHSVGWEMGALWHVDRQVKALRCVDVWHTPELDAAEFESLSRKHTFAPGEGLPGRVWASREPFWINEITTDDNFPRIAVAAKEGVQSAFGFPILLGGEVYGIIEFFSREPREPDKELLETMSTIGSQISQLIERRRAEEAMRESETRFRTLAETASDAIITIDEESRILFVNQAVEDVFGYTVQEMIGAHLTLLMPEYMRHLHIAGFGRYVETGRKHSSWQAVELPGLRKDGQEIPLELSFGEFSKNGKRYFTGIARDVTERRRAEEALRVAREERLVELERVRKRIATDLHDDIGSSLTQISILSEVAHQKVGAHDSSIAKHLKMIAAASRELVDSMSDIVWAINPQKDHLSDLQQRMRRFASDVFTARNIDFRLHSPDRETDIQLGANLRREVFLIFKESINNMVKHSGCARADIEFGVAEDQLFLRLTDDGRGFDGTHNNDDGHGLMSMRERALGLGAELEIITHKGSGTTIMLQVPLGRGLSSAAQPRG